MLRVAEMTISPLVSNPFRSYDRQMVHHFRTRLKATGPRGQNGRIPLLILITLVCLFTNAPGSAAQHSVSYDEYLALIGRSRGEALNAATVRNSSCRSRLRTLSNQLNAITQIVMPDGSVIAVDHTRAGLPVEFPFCESDQLVGFLNGICPPTVCLTTGQVVAPPDPPQGSTEDVTFSNLADFSNAEALATTVPENISPQPEPQLGAGTQQTTAQNAEGEATGAKPDESAPADDTTGSASPVVETALAEEIAPAEASGDSAPDLESTVGELSPNQGEAAEFGETGGGLEETAASTTPIAATEAATAQEASREEVRRSALVWWIVGGVIALLSGGVALLFYFKRQKETPLRPETEKKVREEVQSGRALLTQGEYRQAIRKLFNATLHILEDRGMLRFEQTHTNYELLRAVSTNPSLIPHLAPVIDAYDRVWYGYEPLARSEFETLSQQIESLKLIQRPL